MDFSQIVAQLPVVNKTVRAELRRSDLVREQTYVLAYR